MKEFLRVKNMASKIKEIKFFLKYAWVVDKVNGTEMTVKKTRNKLREKMREHLVGQASD